MNKLIIYLVVLLGLTTFAHQFEHEWNSYKLKHSRKYQNQIEEKVRMENFIKHKNNIVKHNELYNKGLVSFEMSLNKYSDLSHDEFIFHMNEFKRSRNMRKSVLIESTNKKEFTGFPNAVLPKMVDWRKKGAVTPVKIQDECCSCWAFATTGTIEGLHFRKTGHLISLSEQNLIDCVKHNNSDARGKCEAHSRHDAYEYIQQNGIATEHLYPYRATGGSCKRNLNDWNAKIQGHNRIPIGDERKLHEAIAFIGPISVCVDASHDSFLNYSKGIYHEPNCTSNDADLNHAVLVIGYDTDEHGREFYIVKNSWGNDWGEGGYMRLARNRKNHCGIATDGSFPLV